MLPTRDREDQRQRQGGPDPDESTAPMPPARSLEVMEPDKRSERSEVTASKPPISQRVRAWLLKWHLPLMLITVVILGYAYPPPGLAADEVDLGGICFANDQCVWSSVGSLCVTVIFLMSGLKLKTEAIKKALSAWKAGLFGLASILLVTPCISFAVATADFGVPEFAIGLALFFCMPTTLSSGPIIVGQAKGNVALALMLTVVSNLIGVFTAPLFVAAFLSVAATAGSVNVSVNPVPIILKLVFTILIPLLVGKTISSWSAGARAFVKRHSVALKLLSSFLLAIIPWMKISSSADSFRKIDAKSFVLMALTGIAVHLLFLAINFIGAAKLLRLALPEESAVVIVASQKTLPVAITILDLLPPGAIGAPGIVAIPVIVAHLSQILIDSVVASRYASRAAPEMEDEEDEEDNSNSGADAAAEQPTDQRA